jgi:outer membrane protein assembly factor BamA
VFTTMRVFKKKHILLLFSLLAGVSATAQTATDLPVDSTATIVISGIFVQGNTRTKDYIVTRDLTFKKGDTLLLKDLAAAIDRSQKNIYNSTLFNEVKLETVKPHPGECDVFITVKERWYIIPSPVFELYDRNYKEWWNTYNHDIRRVTYGIRFSHKNFSGRKDKLDIFLITGFSKQVLFRYSQPYADHRLRHGFSISAGYSEKIGDSYQIRGNTFMPRDTCRDYNGDGKPDISGDSCVNYRLFSTKEKFIGLGYTYRQGLYTNHIFNLSVVRKTIADTIARLNRDYFGRGSTRETYVQLSYGYNYSKLDFNVYPLVGHFQALGAQAKIARYTTSQLMLYGYYGKYIKLVPRLYFSTQVAAVVRIPGDQSFYNLKSSNLQIANLRGLEQYTVHGTAEGYLKNTLRFRVVDRKFRVPVLKIKNHEYVPVKLYLKAFGDFGYSYIKSPNNKSLNNVLLRTGGVGLDIITLYDLSIKIDFSFNQLGQYGVYFK